MNSQKTFGRSIVAGICLLTAAELFAEDIKINSRMIVKNNKGEAIKGAYVFPGQSLNGKKTKAGILISTPKGEFLLVNDENSNNISTPAVNITISGYEQLGNLKSFPILKFLSIDKNDQILINLYQYIRNSTGEKFKHLIYSYILKPHSARPQFSFRNKLNPKYILLDRFSQDVWGGTDVDMCLEVAVWDEKQSVVVSHKSFDFEITSD